MQPKSDLTYIQYIHIYTRICHIGLRIVRRTCLFTNIWNFLLLKSIQFSLQYVINYTVNVLDINVIIFWNIFTIPQNINIFSWLLEKIFWLQLSQFLLFHLEYQFKEFLATVIYFTVQIRYLQAAIKLQGILPFCGNNCKVILMSTRAGNLLIRTSLICSFFSNQISDCERFPQIAQDKWVIVSESLRSLRGNERSWANRSGHSRQMSDRERLAEVAQRKLANERFAQNILA